MSSAAGRNDGHKDISMSYASLGRSQQEVAHGTESKAHADGERSRTRAITQGLEGHAAQSEALKPKAEVDIHRSLRTKDRLEAIAAELAAQVDMPSRQSEDLVVDCTNARIAAAGLLATYPAADLSQGDRDYLRMGLQAVVGEIEVAIRAITNNGDRDQAQLQIDKLRMSAAHLHLNR